MITANGKLLTVLSAFSSQRPSLSLTQLSSITGLPVSTVHRVAAELVQSGLLERTPRGPFVVGMRAWELAAIAPRAQGLREVAIPFMGDLYEATRENVQLAILEGDSALLVERIAGRRAVPLAAGVGERLPLHASGVGHVLLAFGPPDVLERAERGELPEMTPRTIHDPQELRRRIEQVHRQGYAVSIGAIADGAMSVAAPILNRHGGVEAALSIVLTESERDVPRLVPAVVAIAKSISRSMLRAQVPLVPASAAQPIET